MIAIVQLVLTVLTLYTWVIIFRAVVSWMNPDPANEAYQLLLRFTEPVLEPLRRLIPPRVLSGIDLSPILAILLIQVVRYLLIGWANSTLAL